MKSPALTLLLHFATQIANYFAFFIEKPWHLTNSHQSHPRKYQTYLGLALHLHLITERLFTGLHGMKCNMKILIVDDAEDIRAWLKILLEKAGWEVEQACTGTAACRILESSDIRIVITDWIMPGMDGIQLIDWIRTPASPSVLYARLSVARRILSIQQELLAQQEQLRESRDLVTRAYALVQEDLKGASAAQRSLLPANGQLSNKVETAWFYQPAMGVSGDYLDIFTAGEGKLVFYLLDVSGHGITAALRSSAISQLMRPISGLMDGMDTKGPAHVMERLNRHICEGNSEMDYLATMVLGDFDAAKGILRIASAGHPPPFVLAEDGKVRSIDGGGIPLGIDAVANYTDMETLLKPGEMVLLYSDGLLECENEQGQQMGLNALARNVEMDANLAPAEMLASLENRLGKWTAGIDLVDDVSALALKFSGERPATHPVNKEFDQCRAA
jgi:sigma-B regulation protein RsbU (phosphoserine phosphatase)